MKANKTTRKTAMTDAEIKKAIRRDKEWMDNLDPEDEIKIPEGGIKGLFGDDDDESADKESEEFAAEGEFGEDDADEEENDEIAEITNVRGKARAHVVDPSDFLNGQGTNFIRTGLNIYVATDGCGRTLAAPEIAERARGCFGPPGGRPLPAHAGEYDLVDNNCHTFVVRCVTGREPSRPKLNDRDVAAALKRVFKCERVTWEPTGFSTVSCSFDDEDG